ncbi:MAG: alternative ribosome rescue aminoacyl-tRNA hydrolase ArfB [Draconibacterium sp.]
MKLSEERKQQLLTELVFTATRSSGPGGQNVNKVSSRVELRFSIANSSFLSDDEKDRIRKKLNNRINLEDELLLSSQAERSQLGNKEKATARFFELVEKALTIPRKRLKTAPSQASRLKRLDSKKKTSQKKQLRKPPENF